MRDKRLVVMILLFVAGATVVSLVPKTFYSRLGSRPQFVVGQSGNSSTTQENSGIYPTSGAGTYPSSENLAAKAGELPPPLPVATNIPPMIILQNARRAMVQYAQVYGGNPVGTNPEITSSLLGDNPKHINFITPDSGLQVNDKGEMLDAWGTPLFFHQISGRETDIHSAGQDKIMWTADDLVLK